ncbi:unnamed protein product [Fusarium langsethiae]|nr:unnamed protein product [Fusarium langsethiae]GKU16020.1 unnamed protein product [Fusarium langsethiae]
MSDSADRVFHILELAQKTVYDLELKDLCRVLPVTKGLWENRRRIPHRVWAGHLRRLGYPDDVVRDTSQCLCTSCISIAQAVDCIGRGVRPTSKRIKMDDVRQKGWFFSKCEIDMEPPFVLQSSSPYLVVGNKVDLYILDGNDLKLLKTDAVGQPDRRIFDGYSVLVPGTDYSLIVRNLQDWSTTARFETRTRSLLEGDSNEKSWFFHDEHIISLYAFWVKEPTKGRMVCI